MRFLPKVLFATILVVYLVVLAGGVVRMTGAGMGCPDWPKCFGLWVPPTDAAELPVNYQEIFGAKLKGEVVFNVTKTWIEYVNRLLGVLAGLFVLVSFVAAAFTAPNRTRLWCGLAVVCIAFQGWLGSKVVSTELHPVLITAHMLVAIVLVFVLIQAYVSTKNFSVDIPNKKVVNRLLVAVMLGTVIQIVLGTQVRELIDTATAQLGYAQRGSWLAKVNEGSILFYVHRSFSLLLLGLQLYIIRQVAKVGVPFFWYLANLMLGLVGLGILSGMGLAYLGMPAVLQPLHLTIALGLIGLQWASFAVLNKKLA